MQQTDTASSRRWLILGVLFTGAFKANLDASNVHLALPTITSQFRILLAQGLAFSMQRRPKQQQPRRWVSLCTLLAN